jgi:triosephosphate isomerase
MRTPLIAGNWKMYKSIAEAVDFVGALVPRLEGITRTDVLVAPTFAGLAAVARAASGSRVLVAAQDVAAHRGEGAYTGEVSAEMILDAGATHAIVGHSERRQYFAESDESVNCKVKAALGAGLVPILCVGEMLEDRDAGRADEVVEAQITRAIEGLTASDLSRTIAAYEPVWAIGTGRSATPELAQQMHRLIRDIVAKHAGTDVAEGMRILYGGSVKPDNIAELMDEPDIDGGLVGGASLQVETFVKLVEIQESLMKEADTQ